MTGPSIEQAEVLLDQFLIMTALCDGFRVA